MRSVRIQANGRVTIPKAVREQLGWKPGDAFVVRDVSEGVMIEKISGSPQTGSGGAAIALPKTQPET